MAANPMLVAVFCRTDKYTNNNLKLNFMLEQSLNDLTESRKQLISELVKMGFNNGNDLNGVKEKWKEMKEQISIIDKHIESIIIKISVVS